MEIVLDPNATKRKYFIRLVVKNAKPGSGSSIQFLNQRTWTYPVSNLSEIIKQAPFVIVGGVATRLYMPERMTLDIDILVKAEDAQLVYQDLIKANSQKISIRGPNLKCAIVTHFLALLLLFALSSIE